MSEFWIDTSAMADANHEIVKLRLALVQSLEHLRGAGRRLATQRGVCGEEKTRISQEIRRLEEMCRELEELAEQAAAVSRAYENAESRSAAIVEGLPTGIIFGAAAGASAARWRNPLPVQVTTHYRGAGTRQITGNSLPCESWLWERMAAAHHTAKEDVEA